jgi:hypothetical protein
MTRPITILYEDSAADGPVKEYGPHLLVRQCVADRLGKSPWELSTLEGMPRNGASNIVKDCRRVPPQIGRDGRLVVAVYDADKIHREVNNLQREVKLPAGACKRDIKPILRAACAWQERLVIVFLEENIETVLEAVCACAAVSVELRRLAVERKQRNERDIVLRKILGPSDRALRDAVLQRVQSLGYLVDKVAAALAGGRLSG